MEVRRLAGHGGPGEMAARSAPTMDAVRIRSRESRGQRRARRPGPPRPALRASADRVLDDEVARDDVPPPRQTQRQIVAMRTELELEILLVDAEQEELDDLVVPESVAASGRPGRRRIAVTGGLDLDLDGVAESELDRSELAGQQGLVVPGPAKLEVEAFHA